MIVELCGPQSNKSDWHYATQLRTDDESSPIWPSPPPDLVTTFRLIDSEGVQRFSSNDGSIATVVDESYLTIDMPADSMETLFEGRYAVHLKFETDGYVTQLLLGYLPVYEGF